jgi:hypothetical protein
MGNRGGLWLSPVELVQSFTADSDFDDGDLGLGNANLITIQPMIMIMMVNPTAPRDIDMTPPIHTPFSQAKRFHTHSPTL